ncbi:MAG: methyltransferase domain-containing protein [Candidatus Promineifilaceae bacterium]
MYEQIASYYDLTHAQLVSDVGFVLALAGETRGRVLELGCGTGRLLLPLARAGYEVTGVDSSPAMLALAREKINRETEAVRGRVHLHQTDMTELGECGRDYALILIPYNTFMHLSPRQADLTLRQIRRCLRPGGRLFIDLINPFAVAQTPNDHLVTLEHLFTDPATGHTVLQFARNHLDEAQQVLQITWIYDATPPQGGPVQRQIVPVAYHYYFPHEIELLLNDAGLQMTAWYGHYNHTPFAEESERLMVVAVLAD